MSQQITSDYLEEILKNLVLIQKVYGSRMSEANREILHKFERVYQYIFAGFTSKQISSEDILGAYGYFLQTIKRFKRKIENKLKLNQTDYDAFMDKYKSHNITLVPLLLNELILDPSTKSTRFDLARFTDVNFQHHLYTNQEQCDMAISIFDYLKVFDNLKIDKEMMNNLVREISINYNIIPYHNFTHAFQLFQLLFTCYEKSDLREFVDELEIFSALISGLAHDINHKGVNNGYKIKKSQKNNIITSEQAVLENMHCASFFNILHQNEQMNIIDQFTDINQRNQIKKLIITSILATDMSKHNKLVAKFTKRVEASTQMKELNRRGDEPSELINFLALKHENLEDRRFVLNIIVHACDISNPVMGYDNYMNWCYLLSQEFQDQTIKEAEKGLEVTGFLKYKDLQTFYGGQMFFSKSMVLPLWKQIGDYFSDLKFLPDQLEENVARIIEEKKKIS